MVGLCRTASFCLVAFLCCACSPNVQRQPPDVDLAVLTINLHTYQEIQTSGTDEPDLTSNQALQRIERYSPIFDRIAAGIDELDPDIICFQEVGEWSADVEDDTDSVEFGSTDTNMAHQILSRLNRTKYYYVMDWSHYGWKVWMEGSAIFSKYPIAFSDSRFISSPETGTHDSWKSRNVPMAVFDVPLVGATAVYSVHTGWWNDPAEPFQDQFHRLLDWMQEPAHAAPTRILCGDFNAPADGPAYQLMTTGTGLSDQYLLANPNGMFDTTIGGGADGWEGSLAGKRIDYVLMNDDSPLEVIRAKRVFTNEYLGRVSDHVGVYVEFARTPAR